MDSYRIMDFEPSPAFMISPTHSLSRTTILSEFPGSRTCRKSLFLVSTNGLLVRDWEVALSFGWAVTVTSMELFSSLSVTVIGPENCRSFLAWS